MEESKNIYEKLAIIFQKVAEIEFQKDQVLDGVSYISEAEIKTKIRPLFVDAGLVMIPRILKSKRGNGIRFILKIVDPKTKEHETIECYHEKWEGVPFGATITMAEKYTLKVMFMINIHDDNAHNIQRMRKEVEDKLRANTSVVAPPPVKADPGAKSEIPLINSNPDPVVQTEEKKTIPLNERVSAVTGGAPIQKEEKKKEEKVTAPTAPVVPAVDPAVMSEYLNKINEGWMMKAVNATNSETALKELDKLYLAISAKIYVHDDYVRIGVNLDDMIKIASENRKETIKKSNAKWREYIIEFRLFGKEKMMEKMAAYCKMTVDELNAKLNPPPSEVKKTPTDYGKTVPNPKANENITNEIPMIADPDAKSDIPSGAILNQSATIEIPELSTGNDGPSRKIMQITKMLTDLRQIGIGEKEIKFALGESRLCEKYNHEADGIVMDFLKIAPVGEIREMIEFVKKEAVQS